MAQDLQELFNNAKLLIEDVISSMAFQTWITPLEIASMTDDKILLIAPSSIYIDQVQRYMDAIVNAFKFLTHKVYTISFITQEDYNAGNLSSTSTESTVLPINSNLNPKYTFESFVIGDNNRFAHAAAFAVSEAPGTSYNPLFIHGGVGIGKTHLMHAIGHEILKRDSSKKVVYVTSEKFTNEFINGIKDNKNEQFRQKYRNIDVLLIDDIQFIAGKEGIQEEFFHTFNTIHENKGQIVLTSDKPPKDINPLSERLKSRFDWGLLVDISAANYETRLAILRKKVQLENIVIDDIILSNIATKVDSNIRELEGTLNKIVAQASLTHSPITFELAEKAINDVISKREKIVSSEYIKETVSKYFNITVKDLDSSKRSNDIAYPRQIAMYLCREIADIPYKKIGDDFGKRDHSTVMHACNKVSKDIKVKDETRLIVESVKNIILNPNPS
jgi:chromosomal replication initiator protein